MARCTIDPLQKGLMPRFHLGKPMLRTTPGRQIIVAVAGFLVMGTAIVGVSSAASAHSVRHKESAIEALAQSKLIKSTALPGKWTQSAYGSGGGSGGPSGNPPAVCNSLQEPGVDQNPPFVESPYFDQNGTSVEIQEEIDVYPTAQQAAKDLLFSETPKFQQCFVAGFNQQRGYEAKIIGHGVKVGLSASRVEPMARYGQAATDIRVTTPISGPGGTLTSYYDNVIIVQGRYEAIIEEADFQSPVPVA